MGVLVASRRPVVDDFVSPEIELVQSDRPSGLGASRGRVFTLSGLFGVDAFAGGLVTQSLVALFLLRKFDLDPAVTPVAHVMSTELLVADIGESCEVCLHRMQQAHVRHLIVLDQGRLAGILSLRDLMAVDLEEKAETISLLNAYVS